ncbi:MAG TPA: response regulator transcription factor [Dehalococcoidia bacterium]|nr:response regulator transcription factor [Dehalococcoidia bacterium]
MSKVIDVMIVDDHPIVRYGITAVVNRSDDMQVVAETGCMGDAINSAEALSPDVVTVDVRMGEGNGVELCRQLRAVAPNTRVLILSAYWDELTLANALEAGASGYLLKGSETTDLPQAIRTVMRGELVFDTTVADAVARTLRRRTPQRSGLTGQERKILALVGHGLTNKSIASTLFLSPHTVKDYLSSILSKLQAKNRAEAVLLATRDHLI